MTNASRAALQVCNDALPCNPAHAIREISAYHQFASASDRLAHQVSCASNWVRSFLARLPRPVYRVTGLTTGCQVLSSALFPVHLTVSASVVSGVPGDWPEYRGGNTAATGDTPLRHTAAYAEMSTRRPSFDILSAVRRSSVSRTESRKLSASSFLASAPLQDLTAEELTKVSRFVLVSCLTTSSKNIRSTNAR